MSDGGVDFRNTSAAQSEKYHHPASELPASSRPATDNNDVIRNDNANRGTDVTNKTGNYSLTDARTGLHGGNYTTCYPIMAQIDWWGNYGNSDSNYGGNFGAAAE